MNRTKETTQLLRPVNGWFIIASMIMALLLNFLPLGKIVWRPDILAVVLVFWSIHQPKKMSFFFAFFLGLLMDVHYGVLLGQHAMAYVLACFIAAAVSRRVMWFDMVGKMVHVFPIFILMHVVLVLIHWVQGDVGLSWQFLWAPVIEILIWPVADFLLLRPQKSVPEKTGI